MSRDARIWRGWVSATIVFALAGCGTPAADAPTETERERPVPSVDLTKLAGMITINGSSTLEPVSEAVAEEFQKATRGNVKVTVGIAGTGGGFKKFCRSATKDKDGRGEIDICDASRPILKDEIEIAREHNIEYIELPVCFDALTVAVHPSNPLDSITVADLKTMWEPAAQGKINRWNQVRPEWPDAELTLYGAGSDSGTFDYFTEAIVGKAKSSRGDYTPNEDDNALVQGIAGNKHALGYIPFAYYEPNKDKLKALKINWEKNDAGAVAPSLENVVAGKYNPLSRPLFIYVNRLAAGRPEVRAFVEFYLQNAVELVTEKMYLPLPEKAYAMGLERLGRLQTGTGFDGNLAIGLPVEEILKRQPRQ